MGKLAAGGMKHSSLTSITITAAGKKIKIEPICFRWLLIRRNEGSDTLFVSNDYPADIYIVYHSPFGVCRRFLYQEE